MFKKEFSLKIKIVLFIALTQLAACMSSTPEKISVFSWHPIPQPKATGILRTVYTTEDGVYAGTSSGLYYSAKNETSWQLMTTQDIPVLSLFETDDKKLLVGTYRQGVLNFDPSTKKWRQVGLQDSAYVWDIVKIKGRLFASSVTRNGQAGVYTSLDSGRSWLPTQLEEKQVWSLSVVKNSDLYAGTNGGLYVSSDLGSTWEKINDGIPNQVEVSQVLEINDTLLAATGVIRSPGRGIFSFDADTRTWHPYGNGLPKQVSINHILKSNSTLFAATKSYGEQEYAVYQSKDLGRNWQPLGLAFTVGNHLAMTNINELYVATEGRGLWQSKNMQDWTNVNHNIRSWDVFDVIESSDGQLLAATEDGIWHQHKITKTWRPPQSRQGAAMFVQTPDGIILSSANNDLLVNSGEGDNWQRFEMQGSNVIKLYVDGSNWYVMDIEKTPQYSNDSGKTWEPLLINQDQAFRSLIKTSNGHLLASNRTGIYRSVDSGKHWVLDKENMNVWHFAQNSKGHLFASVYGQGMFISLDNGNNWQSINNGFGENPIRLAWSILVSNDVLYIAAFDRGFFQSFDNGINWKAMNKGLNKQMALSLYQSPDGTIYGGTSTGIFKWSKFKN